ALPELYPAVSQGVVAAQQNPIATIYSNKFFEIQKHLAIPKPLYQPIFHVINAKSWAKLTPEQQAIMREESVAAGWTMRRQLQAEEEGQIDKMKAAGMIVTRPELAPFRAAMSTAYA